MLPFRRASAALIGLSLVRRKEPRPVLHRRWSRSNHSRAFRWHRRTRSGPAGRAVPVGLPYLSSLQLRKACRIRGRTWAGLPGRQGSSRSSTLGRRAAYRIPMNLPVLCAPQPHTQPASGRACRRRCRTAGVAGPPQSSSRSSGRLLCTHLVEAWGVDAAGSSGLIHTHKGHGRTGGCIGAACIAESLCAHRVGGSAGRSMKAAPRCTFDHLPVFKASDAGHAGGDDLGMPRSLLPLAGQLDSEPRPARQGGWAERVADAHLADAGEGGLQCGRHLGAHLAFQRVTVYLFSTFPCQKNRDGVDDAVAVLAEAADADVMPMLGTPSTMERHGVRVPYLRSISAPWC